MKPTQAKREISDTILSANNRLPEDNLNIYFEGIKMMIYLNNVYSENILKVIIDTIVATGYFISQYKVSSANIDGRILKSENEFFKNLKKITNFTFICEPKWDLSVKNIPKKIYHITLTKYTDNILKNGLLPSSEKKKGFHPERNYFCKNYKDVSVMLLSFIKNDIFNRNYYDKED